MSAETLFGETLPTAGRLNVVSSDGGNDEWITPRHITEALGPFDLDPCSPGERRPWDTARVHYDAQQNGLRQPWFGRVWLNPPYSTASAWLARLAEHGAGTALLFARTETALWHDHIWPHATAFLFLRGRLAFHYVTGKRAEASAGAPSVLIAYGDADANRLATCALDGAVLYGTHRPSGSPGG